MNSSDAYVCSAGDGSQEMAISFQGTPVFYTFRKEELAGARMIGSTKGMVMGSTKGVVTEVSLQECNQVSNLLRCEETGSQSLLYFHQLHILRQSVFPSHCG